MKKRRHTKLVREGTYAAEVDVELIDADDGWSPYLSLEDAYKLDAVREALGGGYPGCRAACARVRTHPYLPVSVGQPAEQAHAADAAPSRR